MEFLEYLVSWEKQTENQNEFLTIQTYKGLVVTLKGTLELVRYLCDKVDYKYLMTRRINQDALEVKIINNFFVFILFIYKVLT